MYRKFVLLLIILLSSLSFVTPSTAEAIYTQDFEDPNILGNFFVDLSSEISATVTSDNVYSGDTSLHVVSTNVDAGGRILIPLNIPFTSDLTISLNHYFIEGIPYYWLVLFGNTDGSSNVRLNLEYGNSGPLWYTNEIVFVDEFGIALGQWDHFEIDLLSDINIISNTPGKPWETYEPTMLSSLVIGVNPVWEPYEQRNFYVDDIEIVGTYEDSMGIQSTNNDKNPTVTTNINHIGILGAVASGIAVIALVLIMVNTSYYLRKNF